MARRAPRYLGIRDRLKTLRQKRGLSLNALGIAAGLTYTTIHNIETGRTVPGLDTVEKIADALGISPSWLGFGEGDAVPAGTDQTSHQGADRAER